MNIKPNLTNYWTWKEQEYRFDIFKTDSFSDLVDVTQVYVVVVDREKKKVLLVYNKQGVWLLPGGKVEEGETLLQTLIREVKEETNRDVKLDTVTPLYYQLGYKKGEDGSWLVSPGVQVRYIVDVLNDLEFISDPDNGDIIKVEWVDIDKVNDTLKWGDTSLMIQEEVKKYIIR